MSLINDTAQIRYNAAGADLIIQAQNLLAQRASLSAKIAVLKPQVKAHILNDIWNRTDVTNLMDLYRVRDDINVRLGYTKTEMQNVRSVMTDATYAAEIYAQEILIP